MMVQQPGKRSYFYFLSFAKGQKKWHGAPPPQRRRGSCANKTRKATKILYPRPAWDNTIHDLSVWKLSPADLEAKKRAHKSSFHNSLSRSSVTSTGERSPPGLVHADDRSGLSSQDGSVAHPLNLARASVTSEINLAAHGKTDGSSKTDVKTLDLKLSVNYVASERCCPVKGVKNGSTISRFGKENKVLKSLQRVTKTSDCRVSSAVVTTDLIYSGRKITHPPASRVFSSTAHAPGDQSPFQPVFQSPNRTIVEADQTTEQSTCSSPTTVDFEDEVQQFDAEKKQHLERFVSSVTKSRRRIPYRNPRIAIGEKKRCNRIQELAGTPLTCLKFPLNAMDTSSPTRYTHHPSFRGGVIDSSDDSVSGPLENLRRQKGPQSATKLRRHHNQMTPEAKGHHPTEKIQSFSWNPTPQKNELVNLKGEPDNSDNTIQSSRSGRTKVVKRHFGNVQKTSPIMEWNGDLEVDSDDQLSHRKDFQQYMVKFHRDLMKEFRDLKLSLSRQIVNLQLDVDKILANQKAASSKGFQGLPPHRPGSATEGNILELVDENEELPAYSSLKFRQDLMKPASPSSGESYHVPSSKLESQYNGEQKGTHFDAWPQEESLVPIPSHKSFATPAQSHIFSNLQNNPIYHVQTSSDKRGGSSDSDNSTSSIELTQLNYREAMGSFLETKPESDARQCLFPDQLNTVGVSSRAARSQGVPGLQRKNSNGNSHAAPSVTYGEFAEISETAIPAENQHCDLYYRDCKLDANGHTRSYHVRSKKLDEQRRTSNSEATLEHILQSGSLQGPRKDEISMSSLLGTYTPKARASREDVSILPDTEPHLGTPGRNSPRPAEKKSRSASRPLFAEEPGKTSRNNLSTTSPTSTYIEPPNHQPCNRKGAEHVWLTYGKEEPQNQQYGKAVSEERQPTYIPEESEGQHYDKGGADQGRPTYSRVEPQSQQYGKAEVEYEQPIYTREETLNPQYGRAEAEEGRSNHAREQPPSRQYGKLAAEQGRTRSQNSVIEKQRDGEPYTLRGWAAAFLQPPTEITIKTQGVTLQTGSPKTDCHSSGRDSPTEQSLVQESPERERHREKEIGNQYAVRQFAGKSSKGGCAWTVSEPASSPNNSQKGSPASGTTTSKSRPKHHYPANNS